MANSCPFPQANLLLTGPKGGNISDLQTYRDDKQIISCWVLSAAEKAEVQRTGQVWLGVMSLPTAPPVWVSGHSPFASTTTLPLPQDFLMSQNRRMLDAYVRLINQAVAEAVAKGIPREQLQIGEFRWNEDPESPALEADCRRVWIKDGVETDEVLRKLRVIIKVV